MSENPEQGERGSQRTFRNTQAQNVGVWERSGRFGAQVGEPEAAMNYQ